MQRRRRRAGRGWQRCEALPPPVRPNWDICRTLKSADKKYVTQGLNDSLALRAIVSDMQYPRGQYWDTYRRLKRQNFAIPPSRLGRSTIRGADLGLFSERTILPGAEITGVRGRRVTNAEFDRIRRRDPNAESVRVNARYKWLVEFARDNPNELGQYANDGAFRGRNQPYVGQNDPRVNAELAQAGRGRNVRIFLQATRRIQPGDEVFVAYGRQYWVDEGLLPAEAGDVRVADSGIVGAGRGLFANRDFRRGEHISFFRGRVIPAAQHQRGVQDTLEFRNGRHLLIEFADDDPNQLAQYANDIGFHNGRYNGRDRRFNARLVESNRRPVFRMRATRAIQAGDEIFVPYGIQYWRDRGLLRRRRR